MNDPVGDDPARSPEQGGFDGKAFVAQLSTAPGVYRMYAADGGLLYVGKAGALKRRAARYPSSARAFATAASASRSRARACAISAPRAETRARAASALALA